MLAHLTILFPCMICAIWFLVFLARSGKARQNGYLAILAAIASAFFFFDACFIMKDVGYMTLVLADIVRQFAAPSLALYCWYYLRTLIGDNKDHSVVGYALAVPATMMAMCAVTYLIMGYDTQAYLQAFDAAGKFPEGFDEPIYSIHLFVCRYLYVVVEVIICLVLEIYLIRDIKRTGGKFKNLMKFLFGKGSSNSHHIQCMNFIIFIFIFLVRTILGRNYFINHLAVAMLLSLAIGFVTLLLAFVGILGQKEKITLKDVFLSEASNPAESNELEISSPMKHFGSASESAQNSEEDEDESSYDEESGIDDEDEDMDDDDSNDEEFEDEAEETPHGNVIKFDESLVDRFRVAVIDNKLYLKNGLTVKDVCSEIGSNKTYISKMVNERFGMPFPNFINMLRVNYAKEYLLAHPNAKQEEIADECGFPNAAGFNRSFTKITGMTPRIWLAKNKK